MTECPETGGLGEMVGSEVKPLLRFFVSGLAATATHVTVFVLLVEWGSVPPVIAVVPAFLAAVIVSYTLNYHWTFVSSGIHRVLFPRFLLVTVAGLSLNLLITWLVVDAAGFWYGYALIAVVTLIPLLTFLMSRYWVFRE